MFMWKISKFVLLFSHLALATSFAQNSDNTSRPNLLVCALKTVGNDVAYVVTSPTHLSRAGGIKLLAFSALVSGVVLRADDKIDEELALENYEFTAKPFEELAEIGQIYDDIKPANFALGLTATTLVGGLALRDKKLLQTSRLLVEATVLTQVFTACSKSIAGRARPYTDHGPHDFNLFKFSSTEDYKSMPSGHVSSIFALMTVVAKQYDHWYVEIPAYGFATSVAFQRMTSRNHWASDTMIGAALGYWVSSTLVRKQKDAPPVCSVQPYILAERLGVVVYF